jgi:hypothetical protein
VILFSLVALLCRESASRYSEDAHESPVQFKPGDQCSTNLIRDILRKAMLKQEEPARGTSAGLRQALERHSADRDEGDATGHQNRAADLERQGGKRIALATTANW